MAKKKHRKKHSFKYSNPPSSVGGPLAKPADPVKVAETSPAQTTKPQMPQGQPAGLGDFGHVGQDLRRIGLLAGSFTVAQLILWYLFTHSDLGDRVYGLFKL